MQTILAVDDEEENLMMVEHILANEYRVVAVNSGAMALKYLQQEIPDLILLDIKMPQMDGYEVLNTIRETDEWMRIPVIFLTSYTKNYNDKELLESGVADYIHKPVDTIMMKRRIDRTMTRLQNRQNWLHFKRLQDRKVIIQKEVTNIFVPVTIDNMEARLPMDKIMYIERQDKICIIHTKHMEIKSKMKLDNMQTMLREQFIRTSPNMLINMNYIRSIGDGKLTMEDGRNIILSKKCKVEFMDKILDGAKCKIKI